MATGFQPAGALEPPSSNSVRPVPTTDDPIGAVGEDDEDATDLFLPDGLGDGGASASESLSRDLRRHSEANDDAQEEYRTPRAAPTPTDPTATEIEEHRLSGHAKFRPWFPHCVKG